MNWLKLLIFLTSIFFVKFNFAAEASFKKANEAFYSADYPLAIKLYEELIQKGPTTHLHFNLASAYFQAGEIGKSILHYERALKLKPGDKETKHNLRLAYLETKDAFEPIPELGIVTFWKKILCSLTLNQWGFFSFLFIWLSVLYAIIYKIYNLKSHKKLVFILFGISFIASFLTWQKQTYDSSNNEAIVLGEAVYLRSSPNANAPKQIEIFEGRKVTIIDQVDTWVKVQLDSETAAWLEKKYVERI